MQMETPANPSCEPIGDAKSVGETVNKSISVDQSTSAAGGKSPVVQEQHWDKALRRGAWVVNQRQAETLRTGEHAKDAVRVEEALAARRTPKAQEDRTVSVLRNLGIVNLVGGTIFLVLIALLGRECFFAFAYCNYFNTGLREFAAGHPEQAKIQFGLCIDAQKSVAAPHLYRGLCETQCAQYNEALADFRKALQLDPKKFDVYLARATLYMKMHEYQLALKDCDDVVKVDPLYMDAYRIRASAYNHLLRFDEAIADSTKYLANDATPDFHRADALTKRAFAYDRKQDYQSALRDYSAAIKLNDDDGSLYLSRAIIYMHLKDWQKGLDDSNAAAKLAADNPVIYKVQAVCEAALERSEDSLADLDELVRLHPTVDTHRIRGNQRLSDRDYEGSLEDYDYVLAMDPDDTQTSKSYQRAKRLLQALAPKTSVIADARKPVRQPSQIDLAAPVPALVRRGLQLMQIDEPEVASKYFAKALQVEPSNTNARRLLAQAEVQADAPAMAIPHFRALAAANVLTSFDQLIYANALARCGHFDQAIGLYRDLLSEDPNNDKARCNLIKTLIGKGDSAEAARLAHEGIERSPALQKRYDELLHQATAYRAQKGNVL